MQERQQLAEELDTVAHRAQTAEALLEELQLGICPITSPSHSRGGSRRQKRVSPRRVLF